MMERKFTDDEIVKALEICSQNIVIRHNGLTYKGIPLRFLFEDALDLINRQKAEIERLQKIVNTHFVTTRRINEKCAIIERKHNIGDVCDLIKSEAIKEFAERVKDIVDEPALIRGRVIDVAIAKIDNLVKEMTGEDHNGKPKQDS